jgi:hypothetical protein
MEACQMAALQQPTPAVPGPLVDDPTVREAFADTVAGVAFNQGNFTITFAATRADHSANPPTNQKRVVERMVLPVTTAAQFHEVLGQVLKDLEAKGFIKKMPNLQVVQ